jgi:hypothetical protein
MFSTLKLNFLILCSICAFVSACKPNLGEVGNNNSEGDGADTEAYTRKQLLANYEGSQKKAMEATCSLEKAGWREIPARYLPTRKGIKTHDELIQYMACVANEESTLGKAAGANPVADSCGKAMGYWQLKSCHMGKFIKIDEIVFKCEATNTKTLTYDRTASAKCARYVYMVNAVEYGNGTGPWVGKCAEKTWRLKAANGRDIFPKKCEAL